MGTTIGRIGLSHATHDVQKVIKELGGIDKVATMTYDGVEVPEKISEKLRQFTEKETLYLGATGFETENRDLDMVWDIRLSFHEIIETFKGNLAPTTKV